MWWSPEYTIVLTYQVLFKFFYKILNILLLPRDKKEILVSELKGILSFGIHLQPTTRGMKHSVVKNSHSWYQSYWSWPTFLILVRYRRMTNNSLLSQVSISFLSFYVWLITLSVPSSIHSFFFFSFFTGAGESGKSTIVKQMK